MPRTAFRNHGRLAARQIDVQIGRRIRERRETLGISRATLAGALGLSAEQMRRLEAGIASVFASRLYWLSVILAIPSNEFFDPRNRGAHALPTSDRRVRDGQSAPSPGEVRRLLNAIRRIPDSATRAAMVGLMTAVAEMAGSDGVLPN
jgi:transcriptional regulator with XRE-family HTH domain